MTKTILFLGCGSLSLATLRLLPDEQWQAYGACRHTVALPSRVQAVTVDIIQPECPYEWPQVPLDYVVIALAPDTRTEEAYHALYVQGQSNLYCWLNQHGQRPQRIFFISSTSVYGQNAGQWVNEHSVTEPQRWSGRLLLQAERLALSSGFAVTIVRLAGIYGGQRQSFLQRVRQGYHADGCKNRITNRIHEQDAAALLAHLLQLDMQNTPLEAMYLGVDDMPVEQVEVVCWLQRQLGVSSDPSRKLAPAGTSKRCSNARARATGWAPQYRDYRTGYAQLVQ